MAARYSSILNLLSALTGAFFRALAFLTCLPVSKKWFHTETETTIPIRAFPFAGCLIGILGGSVFLLAWFLGCSVLIASFFTILTLTLITGALHEDGLSDTADAFFVSTTWETRLLIMKDSRIGVFGTLALIFSIGLRTLLLADIALLSGIWTVFFTILAVETASRGIMVWFWSVLPPAKNVGIAASMAHHAREAKYVTIIASLVLFAILIIPGRSLSQYLTACFFALFCTFLCLYGFARLCHHKIGGYTGDTLGAIQQLSTITLLTILALNS